jgi:hypothetical protein
MLRAASGRRPFHRNVPSVQHTKRCQLQAHEFVDTDSAPIISDEKIERTTERSHAAREPRLEVVLGGGLMHSLARNRLDDGNQILDAMTELIRDEAQVLIFLA